MALLRSFLAVSCIVIQMSLPTLGNASWDRRRSNTGIDNRVYPAAEHSFWSSWAEWQPCSRTCGGGVSSRIRYCQPSHRSRPELCPGESKQYRLCSTQLCAKEEQDFRQRQCAAYNNRFIAGGFSKRWVPVQGHHGCDLKCRSLDHGTVYTFGKANDSTPCHKDGEHICLNGRCMEVGCDLLLGSTRRLDACGVCGGRNESCALVRGKYVVGTNYGRRKGAEKGYEEVTLIPAGSTRVYVSETSEQNYIALADSRHRTLVNGNRQVSWPGSYPVAGTTLNYSRQWNQETFNIQGPTKEDLYLMLLVYDRNAAPVDYEYWTLPRTSATGHRPAPNPGPLGPPRTSPPVYPTRPSQQKEAYQEVEEALALQELEMEFKRYQKILEEAKRYSTEMDKINYFIERLRTKRTYQNVEKDLAFKQHELENGFRRYNNIFSEARRISSRMERLHLYIGNLRRERERMDNKVPTDGSDRRPEPRPEPREGPGRDPGDYRRYDDPYAHRDPRHPNQNPANRNPGPGTDSRPHNQPHGDARNPNPHPTRANDPRQNPGGRSDVPRPTPANDPRYHPNPTRAHDPRQNPGDRTDVSRPSSANDPRYYPNPSSRNDPRTGEDPRRNREPDNRIPSGDPVRPGKANKGRCPPCRRVNEKVKNFCDSDFVVRAHVINLETIGSETRYDLGIVESYKNTIYTSHREYVWSPTVEGAPGTHCRCPRLRRNQDYVLMGHFDRTYRKRESRLLITSRSYVRKANSKRDIEMKNLKKMAARKCKRE